MNDLRDVRVTINVEDLVSAAAGLAVIAEQANTILALLEKISGLPLREAVIEAKREVDA